MKKIIPIIFILSSIIVGTRCTQDNDVKKDNPPVQVPFTFNINGVDTKVLGNFVYDRSLQKYKLVSDEIEIIKATDKESGKLINVYAYKEKRNIVNGRTEYSMQVGYYGYYGGCWYWGMLLTGDNGEEIFILSHQNYNYPVCETGIWV